MKRKQETWNKNGCLYEEIMHQEGGDCCQALCTLGLPLRLNMRRMQDLIHTVIPARQDLDANRIKCYFSGIPRIIVRIDTFSCRTPRLFYLQRSQCQEIQRRVFGRLAN